MKTQTGSRVDEQQPAAVQDSEPDLAALIHTELNAAARIEEQARERRRAAGRLLAQARGEHTDLRDWALWVREAGFDARGVELLLQMAAGSAPR